MLKGQSYSDSSRGGKSAKNLRDAAISAKRSGESIRVICRFRPVSEREKTERQWNKLNADIELNDDKTVQVIYKKAETQNYSFDHVFYKPETTQDEVFDITARELIENIFNGYNGTIFAYGQTGAGKSHTMFGPNIFDPQLRGIVPRTCSYIFELIEEKKQEGIEFSVVCSFLEIYRETIRDLLSATGESLQLRESPKGVWVEYLSEKRVKSETEVLDLLRVGDENRAVAATNMNDVSSRSHTLFILYLNQKSPDGSTKNAVLNLVDLAGSEKVGKTGTSGETLEEAKKINQSLSALGNCLNALTTGKNHVPYRDSKLTHLLKESLGGNCKTTLLIACSPHRFNAEETISTLKFGQRAKLIKNVATQNKQNNPEEIAKLYEQLSQEMELLRSYDTILESELAKLKGPSWDVGVFRKQTMASFAGAPVSRSSSEENLLHAEEEFEAFEATTKAQIHEIKQQMENGASQELDEKEKEITELRNNLRIHRAALQKLKSEKDISVHSKNQEVQEIEQNFKQETEALQTALQKNKELENQVSTYLTQNQELQSRQTALMKVSTQLKKQIQENKEELERLQELVDTNETKIEEQQRENEELVESLNGATEKLEEVENQLEMLKKESEEKANQLLQKIQETKTELEKIQVENNQFKSSLKEAEDINSLLNEKVKELEEEKYRMNTIHVEQQEKLNAREEELKKIQYERKVLLGEEQELVLIQAQMKESTITIENLEEVVVRKMKEMEAFKNTIDKLKKEEQRVVTEITKAATGFDAEDFKKLILELVTKEFVSSTTIKNQVEIQLSKPPKPVSKTPAASTKNGKTPTKTSAGRIQMMPHQRVGNSAKPGPALNRRQTMPATKSTSAVKPELTKRQSLPAAKKAVAPKKTPTRMVKNPS